MKRFSSSQRLTSTSLLLAVTVMIFQSCIKTNDFPDLDLLIEKEWTLTSVEENEEDITQECDLDDVLIFQESPDFTHKFGEECANQLDKEPKRWSLRDDYTLLRMSYKFSGNGSGSVQEYYRIMDLQDSILVLREDYEDDNPVPNKILTYRIVE